MTNHLSDPILTRHVFTHLHASGLVLKRGQYAPPRAEVTHDDTRVVLGRQDLGGGNKQNIQ